MIIEITLGVLFAVSLYGNINLLRKQEKLEFLNANQQLFIDDFEKIITQTHNTISEIDEAGTFKSDDEIGAFFTDVKELQSKLDRFKEQRKNNLA